MKVNLQSIWRNNSSTVMIPDQNCWAVSSTVSCLSITISISMSFLWPWKNSNDHEKSSLFYVLFIDYFEHPSVTKNSRNHKSIIAASVHKKIFLSIKIIYITASTRIRTQKSPFYKLRYIFKSSYIIQSI